eukprot:707708-Rhodomonas_salina.2
MRGRQRQRKIETETGVRARQRERKRDLYTEQHRHTLSSSVLFHSKLARSSILVPVKISHHPRLNPGRSPARSPLPQLGRELCVCAVGSHRHARHLGPHDATSAPGHVGHHMDRKRVSRHAQDSKCVEHVPQAR